VLITRLSPVIELGIQTPRKKERKTPVKDFGKSDTNDTRTELDKGLL